MKTNGWNILGVVLLAGTVVLRADQQLEPEKSQTTPAARSPARSPVAAVAEKPIVLSPGAAAIAGNNVNVRGKAGYRGEVFTKLNSGDEVTVLEQVILPSPKGGEPAQWAKIVFPPKAHVWVHSAYVNADKTVKPRRLNVRTGPGENYSIVGILEQGAAVKEVSVKGNWLEIEAPAGAYAFVAASFVRQAATDATVPPVISLAPPEATTVPQPPEIATTPTDTANVVATSTGGGEPAPMPFPDAMDAAPPPAVVEEIDVPRYVSHEGVVRTTVSIQAPTKYALHSKETGKMINYLYSPTPQLEMSRYYGRHIIVSGEEGLDKRWTNTPVLTIQRIYVVE